MCIRDRWIRDGKGFVVIYSVTSPDSFIEVRNILKRIERVKNTKRAPTVIVGNKIDLENKRKVPTEDGKKLAQEFDCPFIETSAKTGLNCNEVFNELVRTIRAREQPTTAAKEKGFLQSILDKCTLIQFINGVTLRAHAFRIRRSEELVRILLADYQRPELLLKFRYIDAFCVFAVSSCTGCEGEDHISLRILYPCPQWGFYRISVCVYIYPYL
eukprot:TRINITY_DN6333_c0_g1_i5.p1 TRINITY_DN6333_c0_g1~~TRINITY_DN6333_c0_g1_i5.p1  ORF type:complete len:234 (+),score=43.32 TRINITY_DN6333_c0_g1_i5:62-703(+)